MRHQRLEHQFVQYIPDQLSEGVLYISMEYGTAAHSCCCGCGEQVVTPFTPTDWKMIYDGESVSLWPSIGNWTLACRSHYMIDRGRVLEAGPWSDRQIAAERSRDHAAKARDYGAPTSTEAIAPPDDSPQLTAEGLLSRVRRWTRRSRR
jgi:hypothetical protein